MTRNIIKCYCEKILSISFVKLPFFLHHFFINGNHSLIWYSWFFFPAIFLLAHLNCTLWYILHNKNPDMNCPVITTEILSLVVVLSTLEVIYNLVLRTDTNDYQYFWYYACKSWVGHILLTSHTLYCSPGKKENCASSVAEHRSEHPNVTYVCFIL